MRKIVVFVCCMGLVACSSWGKKQKAGTAVGAASGAAVGTVLGRAGGHGAEGAVLGAVAGSALGNILGQRMDKQATELDKVAETKRTDEGIVTNLKGDILFDTGEAKLKTDAVKRVDELAAIIKKYPEDRITVVGHTDNSGSAEYNQTLSQQRAEAVKVRMIEDGVSDDKVRTAGMGESQPVATNSSLLGRSKNRRVEMKIVADASEVPNKQ